MIGTGFLWPNITYHKHHVTHEIRLNSVDEDYWSTEFIRSCVPPMYRHLQEVTDDTARLPVGIRIEQVK